MANNKDDYFGATEEEVIDSLREDAMYALQEKNKRSAKLSAIHTENKRLRKAIKRIMRISCGEDHVAENDTEGMGIIYGIAKQALAGGERNKT